MWLSPAPEFDYGFASGHAMGTRAVVAALAVVAWLTRGRWLVLAVGLSFVRMCWAGARRWRGSWACTVS
ncbi:MAG: hypothetical protein M3347_10590 [Armatimonadota bacterium]|nr:hypothetical protein [Armatimonadota bacterium]